MKRILICSILATASLGFSQAKTTEPETGSIRLADEERSVSDFTGVAYSGYFNVYIKLGDKESLRLEGDSEMLKEIETKVEKGVLKIQLNSKKRYWDWNTSDRKKVNVYITAKVLTNVTLSGSGSMKVEGTMKAPDFKATLSGSGNLAFHAEAVNFSATLSGSGNMSVAGNAQHAQLTLSGSGNLVAADFNAKNAEVTVSGSGNVNLRVEKKLKATTSGSGNIRYSGDPEVTETRVGSGKIAKI